MRFEKHLHQIARRLPAGDVQEPSAELRARVLAVLPAKNEEKRRFPMKRWLIGGVAAAMLLTFHQSAKLMV